MSQVDAEAIEFTLLLEAIFQRYGYDFRDYSQASMRRRFDNILRKERLAHFSELQHSLLHEPEFFARLLPDLTVMTSEMFRDPSFYRALREKVLPHLRTYPTFKVWHAGCSTGEEVYSLAIMLKEEKLYDRAVIYATDVNPLALKCAKEGIYRANQLRAYTSHYQKSGGLQPFSDYYTALYDSVRFDPSLRENVVFFDHNLVTDSVFSETHLVLCRNVIIYFNQALQERAINLFGQSLRYKGFLCLGSKETLQFLSARRGFTEFDASERIYQKDVRDGASFKEVGSHV